MIKIEEEPEELIGEFKVYEHCVCCDKPTKYWYQQKGHNFPVCKNCAKKRTAKELIIMNNNLYQN